jgi:dTDP-3-amino-3,4,6-trideoxy-alpha-D-glucose transaminase
LREYGWRERYSSAIHGWNSRLDELQAAFLRVRLAHLETDNARRRTIAAQYRAALPSGLVSPTARPTDVSAEHLFVVRSTRRAEFRRHLDAAGIDTAIHYPVPLHLQPAYAGFGQGVGSLPVAERAAAEVVSLPLFAELTDNQVERVVQALSAWAEADNNA